MFGSKEILDGLVEATRLTRSGRLVEATALIQRQLTQTSASADIANHHGPAFRDAARNDTIDVDFVDVTEREDPSPGVHAPESSEAKRGQFTAGVHRSAVGSRPYKLYVPSGYSGQALPLMVMLHGCTQSPDDFASGTRMNLLAEERQCFVLYPEQTQTSNRSRCWNWFRRGDQARDQGEPEILARMTREVISRYGVEPAKVFVAGMSAGGAMAAVLGHAYPELYAAVGIHSGLPCACAHDVPSASAAMRGMPAADSAGRRGADTSIRVPTIVFHGDRDSTVHPRNGEQVVSQAVRWHDASGLDAFTEQGRVPGGRAYTRTVHRDAAGRVLVEHWLVQGGGHAWFGGSASGSYTDPKGPDASREMLRFFLEVG